MKRLALLAAIVLLLPTISCAKQAAPPESTAIKAVQKQAQQSKPPQYSVFKGRDFSFRYPASWTITSQQRFFARGYGIVSVNNFNREGFWPGMYSNHPNGASWSTEIAQLQVPTDGAFLMVWVFEGPGSPDNLPDMLNKAELKHTSKARGPMETYSMIFQSGGNQYQLNLFLNGRDIEDSKKEALAIIDSLKLESAKQGPETPTLEAMTAPLKVEANGIYEVITENPVIFSDNATRYGEQPLVDIEALGSTDKNFKWVILNINPDGTTPGQPQYVRFRVKVTGFKQSQTIRFKVRPREI